MASPEAIGRNPVRWLRANWFSFLIDRYLWSVDALSRASWSAQLERFRRIGSRGLQRLP
jgi:hypothetical protein